MLHYLAILLAGPAVVSAKAVYCHYMVQGITQAHASVDVSDARAMGCDAFALDITNPTADWSNSALSTLFSTAQQQNFKLFFSLDFAASPDISSFDGPLKQYLGHPAYLTAGPNNFPYLSTFHEGKLGVQGWSSFKAKYGGKIYLVPNFDDLPRFYDDPQGVMKTYGDTIDGLFNWETAWPPSQDHPANVSASSDLPVQAAVEAANKQFMMPISTFQYKDMGGYGNYYRAGNVVLPQRMEEILAMETAPDAVEYLTFNDAGESHYVGNVWPESQPPSYASSSTTATDHSAWRPLIASFATAYKSGAKSSAAMTPINGTVLGVAWYHTFDDASACANKPNGWQAATNSVNYGIVLAESCKGFTTRVTCAGKTLQSLSLSAGLNYASVPGLAAGQPKVEVLDSSGKVVSSSELGPPVSQGGGANCKFNYAVVGIH